MNRTISSEIRKITYQRSTYGILAASAVLSAISGISLIATAQLPQRQMFFDLTQETSMHMVIASTAAGYLFALILGITTSTMEFRHSTAVATYLAQPNRRSVMMAKMLIAAVAGAILQFVSTAFGMGVSGIYVQRYAHFVLGFDSYVRVMAGAVTVGAVLGVVGVAVGSLIRSQITAILAAVLWLQLVEGLVIVFADWLGKWSMRGAITSVFDIAVRVRTPQTTIDMTKTFGPWQSVALLLAYAALFGVVATITSMRRDVD